MTRKVDDATLRDQMGVDLAEPENPDYGSPDLQDDIAVVDGQVVRIDRSPDYVNAPRVGTFVPQNQLDQQALSDTGDVPLDDQIQDGTLPYTQVGERPTYESVTLRSEHQESLVPARLRSELRSNRPYNSDSSEES